MLNAYFKTDFKSNLQGLYSVQHPMTPTSTIYDFKGATLTPYVGSLQLIATDPQSVTFSEDALVFSTSYAKDLRTGITDAEDFTLLLVVSLSKEASSISVILGNQKTGTRVDSQWSVSINSLAVSFSAFAANNTRIAIGLSIGSYVVGVPFVIAVTKDTGNKRFVVTSSLIPLPKIVDFDSVGYEGNGSDLSIGSSRYTSSDDISASISKVYISKEASSASELQNLLEAFK